MEGVDEARLELSRRGIMTRIEMYNFMCHDAFAVSPGPNVTFIHGLNGSGKSAILLAICVCFGASAKSTGRVRSYKEFIQHGKEQARISITILNDVKDMEAFEPETYGSSITVERTIKTAGSTVRLLDEYGKSVVPRGHTPNKELERIKNHFRISPDNPCVVLNQEVSREFLKSASPKDFYRYYFKATQLETLEQAFKECEVNLAELEATINTQKGKLEPLRAEYEKAQETFDRASNLESLDQTIADLEAERAWIHVREAKEETANQTLFQEKYKAKLEAARMQLEEKQAETGAIDAMFEQISAANKELEQQEAALCDRVREIDDRVRVQQSSKREIDMSRQEFNAKLKKAKEKRDAASAKLEEYRREQNQDSTSLIDAKRSEIQALKTKVEELERNLSKADDVLTSKRGKEHSVSEELQAVGRQLRLSNEDMSKHRKQLNRLSQSNDRSALFGDDVGKVQRYITQALEQGKLKTCPIGPLGNVIRVRDKERAKEVELCLGNQLLRSYLVRDLQDMRVLSGIFSECKVPRPNIIAALRPTERYRCPTKPQYLVQHYPAVQTVMDLLSVDGNDPWVWNTLVDQAHVESVLVSSTAKEALGLLHDVLQNDRESVAFVSKVYSSDGVLAQHKNGSTSTRPVALCNPKLVADVAAQVEHLKTEIERVKVQMDAESRQKQSLESSLRDIRNATLDTKSRQESMKRQLVVLRKQLLTSRDEYDTLMAEMEEDHEAVYQAELRDCDQRVSDFEYELQRLEPQLAELHRVGEDLVKERRGLTKQIDDIKDGVEKQSRAFQSATEKAATHTTKIEKLKKKEERYVSNLALIEDEIQKCQDMFNDVLSKAREITSEELQSDRQREDVIKDLTDAKALKAAEEELLNASFDEIRSRRDATKRSYDVTNLLVTRSQNNHHRLSKAKELRQHDFKEYRRRIRRRVNLNFSTFLQSRGFSGGLKIDDKEKTLSFFFDRGENAKTDEARTLSGGERSFTTLCLVFSIAEVINTPFVALDEFDVFMDSVNRAISAKLLCQLGNERKNRQFILITPHDISMIEPEEPYTRIIEMEPPRQSSV